MGKMLLTLLLLCCLSVTAGEVHNVTIDATYFDPASLEFYQPKPDGACVKYSLEAWMTKGKTGFDAKARETNIASLDDYLAAKGSSVKDLLLVSGIKKSNVGYNTQVEQLAYRSPAETKSKRPCYQTCGIVSRDYFLCLFHFGEAGPGSESYNKAYYSRFAVIIINNLFTVYYAEHKRYHVVQYNNNFELYIEGKYKNMDSREYAERKASLRKTYPTGLKLNENGKVGLMAKNSTTVLIPAVYDSLFVLPPYYRFVSAYKNNTPYLFFSNGEPVPLKNLRAVYNSYNVAVITGNSVSWLNPDGQFVAEVKNPVDCGYRENDTHTIEIVNDAFVLKEIETQDIRKIAKTTDYKSIRFITGDTIANDFTGYYIAEKHDGKKGLINPFGNRTEVLIDFDYQTLKFQYLKNLVRIDKNGLSGYWPLNKEARYTQLAAFDKGFARFTLPNGKQGWLAEDGKEYLDE